MSDYEIISDNVIEYCVEVEGKSYIIPARNNTRAAHIDFGGSLGDFRLFNRHLDGKIHVNKLLDLIRYRPSSSGPPAYHKKLPAALMEGNEFFHVLARFSMISQDKLAAKIEEEIDTAIETYRNKPEVLIRFAKRVGAPIPHDAKNNLNALGASLKEFITNNMLSKQQHAKTLFLNHFCRLPRSEQNNLLNNLHADISSPTPKQQYLQKFYQQLRAENNELFNTLKEIDALLLPNISQSYHDLKNSQGENPLLPVGASLNRFKSVLHSRLCNAYFKGNLESETKRIGEILVESRELMQAFSEHYQKVVDPKLPAEERLAAIDSFMDAVKTFEEEAIKPSAMQQFAIAASIFAGSLLGAIIGAAVGLIVGVTVGSILGHAGGAVVGAGAGSVIGAVKGAGFGTVIAMGVAAFLFGSAGAVGGGVSGRGLFFSKTQQAAVDFSKTTRDMLFNEKKAILEATEAQESDESHSHGADPSNP